MYRCEVGHQPGRGEIPFQAQCTIVCRNVIQSDMWFIFLCAFLMESFKDLTGDGYFKMK